jgi:hypothetical protein
MPQYNAPFTPPQLLVKGVPSWLFGSMSLLRGNAIGRVSQTALATGVGSVTVQIDQGPIPLVGDYITVWGTALQTGLFNVTRAVITAVSITPATNAGTISYALTGSTQSATADGGRFTTEPAEQAEALVNNSFSVPCVLQAPSGDSQCTLPLAVTFPSAPASATVTLQMAVRDIAAEYTTCLNPDTGNPIQVTYGGGNYQPVVQAPFQRGYFYRLAVTNVVGGSSPTIIGKIGG